jgi:uncharacterized integral membrane protein
MTTRSKRCPICGHETEVMHFYIGGRGDVPHEVCPVGLSEYDDGHGIIRALPLNWWMLEAAEDEAFRALNRVPVNAADWARAMKVKGGIAAAVGAVTWLLTTVTAHAADESARITYLMGTAADDKAVALDLIAMGACLALGATALRLVQLWREDRKLTRMMRDMLDRFREERDGR